MINKTAGAFDQPISARDRGDDAHEAREKRKKVITKQAYLEIAGGNLAAS